MNSGGIVDGAGPSESVEHDLQRMRDSDPSDLRTLLGQIGERYSPTKEPRQYESLAQRVATLGREDVIACAADVAEDQRCSTLERLFGACVAATYFRRTRQFNQGLALLERVRNEISPTTYPILDHFFAIAHIGEGIDAARVGWRHCQRALETMSNNPGVVHAAALFELLLADGDPLALERALSYCDQALRVEERPRYHFTRAQVLRALGRFDEARVEINFAIEGEDRTASDASLRLTDYSVEASRIEIETLLASTRAELEGLRESRADLDQAIQSNATELAESTENLRRDSDELKMAIEKRLDALAAENQQQLRSTERSIITILALFASALALIQVGVAKTAAAENATDVLLQVGSLALVLGLFIGVGFIMVARLGRRHQ